MQSYGQFCPLAQAAQVLCERWTLLVVRELLAGSTRFSELQRGVPAMSPTLLSSRLKGLEAAGVLAIDGPRAARRYRLTPAGEELRGVVELMGAWGHRWAHTDLRETDLDAGLLMWDMRRSVDPSRFPQRRVVVQFEYPDAPRGGRDWWLIAEAGAVDLCLEDPGHEIDLLVTASLAAMTAVWTCATTLPEAMAAGEIRVTGDPALKARLAEWLCASPLSRLGEQSVLPRPEWERSQA